LTASVGMTTCHHLLYSNDRSDMYLEQLPAGNVPIRVSSLLTLFQEN